MEVEAQEEEKEVNLDLDYEEPEAPMEEKKEEESKNLIMINGKPIEIPPQITEQNFVDSSDDEGGYSESVPAMADLASISYRNSDYLKDLI